MGNYTWLRMQFEVKPDLDEATLLGLRALHDPQVFLPDRLSYEFDTKLGVLPHHPFFHTQRWPMFFCRTNGGSPSALKISGRWYDIDSEFKNYDNELTLFLGWIAPYVTSGLGFSVYSETVNKFVNRYHFFDGVWLHMQEEVEESDQSFVPDLLWPATKSGDITVIC